MALAPGVEKEQALSNAGFSAEEVAAWKGQASDELYGAGFSQQEVRDYFGYKEPDTGPMKAYVKEGVALNKDAEGKPKEAKDWMEAFTSGIQLSTAGLAIRGENPNVILPEHAGNVMEIASMIGTTIGDIPAMVAGGVMGAMLGAPAGGAAGTAIAPGVGTLGGIATGVAVGGAAGGFAAPAALRKIMMDHYEKGDIKTFGEFWNRLSATAWETLKGGTLGVATAGAGRVVGPLAGKYLSSTGAGVASITSEIATMTTVGAALEGEMPNAADFINAGVVIGGFHGAAKGVGKLRRIYSETGERPETTVEKAGQDVILKQEVLSENPDQPIRTGQYEQLELPETGATKSLSGLGGEPAKEVPVQKTPLRADEPSTWSAFYNNAVDDLNPVKAAVDRLTRGEELSPGSDPYKLMRTYKDFQGKVQRAFKFNTIDYKTGAANGEGLEPILKRVPDKEGVELTGSESKVLERIAKDDKAGKGNSWSKLTAYLVSKRAIELSKREIETGIDIEAAKEVVASGRKEYDALAKDLQEFQRRMKKYAEDSGVLSESASKAMDEANKSYIPFYRLMEESPVAGKNESKKPFKRIKGSEREILDPVQSVFQNTAAIFRIAEHNRAVKSLVELQAKNEGDVILQKVAKDKAPITVSKQEIMKAMEEQGIATDGVDVEPFTIFRPVTKDLAENQFRVYENGKATIYETSPDIGAAVKAMNYHPGMTNMWYNVFVKGPAQMLRAGVTLAPDFIVRNFFRDQLTAGLQTKYGAVPFVDAIRSIGHIWKQDTVWQEFISSGGASGSFAEVSRYLKQDAWGMNKETGFMDRVWNVVKTPLDALAVVSELTENIPRLNEFKRGGGVGGSFDQKIAAGFSAREVTVDFSRAGAKIRAVNAIIPFFNIGIQGPERFARAFAENPKGMTAKTTAMITLPSVMLWWANKDDSRYQDAPNWEKDLYWLIPTDKWEKSTFQDAQARPGDLRRQLSDGSWEVNNGSVYRLPKPFEVGILFGTLPERMLNALYKQDSSKFSDFGDTIQTGLIPNLIPTALSPIAEQAVNKSFFTGNQVVSEYTERFLPEYQYTEYTSETAKQLGKLIGHIPGLRDMGPKDAKLASPQVIDNYIRAWTGTLGNYAIQIADKGLRAAGVGDFVPGPASKLADIPVVKAFVMRYPHAKTQNIQDFRNNYDYTQKVVETVKMLAKGGDLDAATKLMKAEEDSYIKLGGIKESLSNINSLIQMTNKNPKMTPNDKRQIIDSLYYQMSSVAKSGNELLEQYRKGLDVAK